MIFYKADVLKNEFEVKGSFYQVDVKGKRFECRNYAQVYRKGRKTYEKTDALFVLVNPGLCAPKQSTYEIPQIKVGQHYENYTLAKTDNTQYQMMRFMKLKNWSNVLIINLSDIRAGNMKALKEKLDVAKQCSFDSHSIFSATRKEELTRVLAQNEGPIIVAWGTNPMIKDLAKRAMQALPNEKVIGWAHEKSPFFFHASPPVLKRKIEWLEYMNDVI